MIRKQAADDLNAPVAKLQFKIEDGLRHNCFILVTLIKRAIDYTVEPETVRTG